MYAGIRSALPAFFAKNQASPEELRGFGSQLDAVFQHNLIDNVTKSLNGNDNLLVWW